MSSAEISDHQSVTELTARIVAAYVANNELEPDRLSKLTHAVGQNLNKIQHGRTDGDPDAPAPMPAVKPNKSVTADHLICLECGRKKKMLKRHLKSTHDLTPEAYRAKYGLRADYPMVAPNHTKRRAEIAKEIGLGQPSRSGSRAA